MSLSITPHQIGLITYCLEQQWAELTPVEINDAEHVLQVLTELEMQSREANQ